MPESERLDLFVRTSEVLAVRNYELARMHQRPGLLVAGAMLCGMGLIAAVLLIAQ